MKEWANSGWADRWLSLPDGSGLPHTHNLVDVFLTSLGDRKMSPWVRIPSGLQLSALDAPLDS